jgi:aminoglycoside phosphotransferase (APT) family kinase protein
MPREDTGFDMTNAAIPRAAAPRRSRNTVLTAVKVTGRVLYERVARPMARTLDQVPGSPDAITPEWMTAALCADTPGAAVTQVVVRRASAGTHERHRLLVSYNDVGQKAGLPTSIFTKSMPSIVTRMVAGFNGHARVEGRFYSDVRPLLEIEAPRCYYSTYDKNTFTGIHLLEDLVATKAATFCNYQTAVTRPMAEDMVDLLATLHGRFYDQLAGNPHFRWLADYPKWFTIGAKKMRTEHYTGRALDAAATLIPPKLMARRAEIWPAIMHALAIHETEPNVFLHSDVHIGNWYQTGTGRMGLCDWQCPSRGHWARDFAYAVSAALEPENRRSWERDLLARYLDRLAAQGGPRIEFARGFDCYRQQVLHAFPMWTITLCHSPLLPSMQTEETTREMIRRIAIAMDDLDALDSV